MVSAYGGLMNELTLIAVSYDDKRKVWYKNQIKDLLAVASYLYDNDILTNGQYDFIYKQANRILSRFAKEGVSE